MRQGYSPSRREVWCLYTMQGAADEDEESPNAFPVSSASSCALPEPTLAELMASFARARPVGDKGERFHWRVRVADESHGHAWMDVVDESKRVQSEAVATNAFAVFAKLLDTSPRATALRQATGPRFRKSGRSSDDATDGYASYSDRPESASYSGGYRDEPAQPSPASYGGYRDEPQASPASYDEPSPAANVRSASLLDDDDDPPTLVVPPPAAAPVRSPPTHVPRPAPRLSPEEEAMRIRQEIQDRKREEADALADSVAQKKEEIRLRQEAAAQEEAEFDRLRAELGPKLKDWSEEFGRKKNIRALLAGMDKVMWPEADWKSISIAELLEPSKVKKAYYKASRFVHPDKLVGLNCEQRYIGKTVFDALSQAMTEFEEAGHT